MYTLQVDCATILYIPKPNKKWIIPQLESVQEFLSKMAMKPHGSSENKHRQNVPIFIKVGHIFRK